MSMSVAATLAPEFEHEMASTRQVLERVPDDKFDWKAHPKSNTVGWVASHLAEIPGWVEGTLRERSWDFNPPGGTPYRTPMLKSRQEVLDSFDANVATAKAAIAATPDAEYPIEWTLLNGGTKVLSMPRIAVIRGFVIKHIVHHRAILCVYLRLNEIPVPGMYGPSGDE